MKNKIIVTLLVLATFGFSNELPPLDSGKKSLETKKVEATKESQQDGKKSGLAYLDICQLKNAGGIMDIQKAKESGSKKVYNCREYYSNADETNPFTINEYDISSPFIGRTAGSGIYVKYSAIINVPLELIRKDKIYILANNFYGQVSGKKPSMISDYIVKINGENIDGTSILVELKGKDEIEIELHANIYTDPRVHNQAGAVNEFYNTKRDLFNQRMNQLTNINIKLQFQKGKN